jgi:hypothetical protein
MNMNKIGSQMGHLGFTSAVLTAIFLSWQQDILESNTRILILAGASILTVFLVLFVDSLTQQAFVLPSSLATYISSIVVFLILIQFGMSLPGLLMYIVAGMIVGMLIGLTRGGILTLLYPAAIVLGLLFLGREHWFHLDLSQMRLWQFASLLAFFLLLFSVLSPTLAVLTANRMSALLIIFLAVWYSPLAGMAGGTPGKVSFISWVMSLAFFILLGAVVTGPERLVSRKLWLAPRGKALLFLRRSKRLLREGSEANIKAFSAIYEEAPTELRTSIYLREALQGNEKTWGKIIGRSESQLGREALQNLLSLQAPARSTLHSSLVAIFSQGVADSKAAVWQVCLKRLMELDKHAALQVCRELAEQKNVDPIKTYLTTPEDDAYHNALKVVTEVAQKASATVLTGLTSLLYQELHNPVKGRAALALQEVKGSSPVKSQMLQNLSSQFRVHGQSNAPILKDILLIDIDTLWAEVTWAAEHGTERHIRDLMEMPEDKIVNQALSRIIDTVDENKRIHTLCGWLGNLLPTPSVSRSIAILLAICVLSPHYCMQFLKKKAYKLPVEVLRDSLAKSDSPLRPVLWQWMMDKAANQSADAVKLTKWIAVPEGAAV